MSRRRFFGVFFGIVGAAFLAVVLYLAFGDLGRHKARIEAFVTKTLGRHFVIEGPLKIRLIPVVDVSAEGVRLGNVEGGSQPHMVEIGKVAVQIGFWSLISGPPDVRSLELSDANLVLERGLDGKGNWVMSVPKAEDQTDEEEEADAKTGPPEVPLVIRSAHLSNVRLTYREARKPDQVVQLDKLSIGPGQNDLLALDGQGQLDVFPLVLKGDAGPLKSLLSARDMRMDMHVLLGKLSMDLDGVVGRLEPLDGIDLTLKVEQPDLGAMLEKMNLPVFATGPVRIDGRFKDVGERTRLDFDAKVGDLEVGLNGTLKELRLAGADLTLKVAKPEMGAMLKALKLPVIATGPMRIDTRIKDAGKFRQVDFKAKLGELDASVQGTLKTRSLVGADLTIKIERPEIADLFQALDLPVIATGPMRIDTRIKDAGKFRQLDFKAKLGDLEASVQGTLKARHLVGSDLKFEAKAADAARLAKVFDISDVPAAPLTVTGHTVWSREEIRFDSVNALIADASVRADGSKQFTGDQKIALNFELAAASLKKLRETWPEVAVSAKGAFESATDRIELRDLQATLGKTQLAGSLLLTPKQIVAELSSPRVDLTPFFPNDKPAETAPATPPPPAEPSKKKFLFGETPLPIEKVKDIDAKVHVAFGELVLADKSLKDVDSNLHVDHGKVTFDMRAAGTREGSLQGSGTLVRAGDGSADLDLKIDIKNVRASLGSEQIPAAEVPPLGVALNMKIHGSSPRQMAAGANGQLLLTQGAGKTKSGFIGTIGGGVLAQLAQKLNPFAKDDPYMKLDCTIARADIVNGQVTVLPVLLQSEKVTITAQGTIDLHTEKLLLDFNTRPRKGIGVSPGMFTNPLIRLEGTLMSPKIGVGAKGVASGAAAAATGGLTVVAGGFFDRLKGEKDLCGPTLTAATQPATQPKAN